MGLGPGWAGQTNGSGSNSLTWHRNVLVKEVIFKPWGTTSENPWVLCFGPRDGGSMMNHEKLAEEHESSGHLGIERTWGWSEMSASMESLSWCSQEKSGVCDSLTSWVWHRNTRSWYYMAYVSIHHGFLTGLRTHPILCCPWAFFLRCSFPC